MRKALWSWPEMARDLARPSSSTLPTRGSWSTAPNWVMTRRPTHPPSAGAGAWAREGTGGTAEAATRQTVVTSLIVGALRAGIGDAATHRGPTESTRPDRAD